MCLGNVRLSSLNQYRFISSDPGPGGVKFFYPVIIKSTPIYIPLLPLPLTLPFIITKKKTGPVKCHLLSHPKKNRLCGWGVSIFLLDSRIGWFCNDRNRRWGSSKRNVGINSTVQVKVCRRWYGRPERQVTSLCDKNLTTCYSVVFNIFRKGDKKDPFLEHDSLPLIVSPLFRSVPQQRRS